MIHQEFLLYRHPDNPIIKPRDFPDADGVRNCGQTMMGDETILLVSVDHRSDGNSDSAETHDVRVDPHDLHDEQAGENRRRDYADRHQCAAQVEQEHGADQSDDDQFLNEFFSEASLKISEGLSNHHELL